MLAGHTVASHKVRLACERFERELADSERDWYPYRYDAEIADRPARFMETFLRPSKGDYEQFALMDWQKFVEGNLYGWVAKDTGLRRFREGLVCVGRGNGKSTLIAGNAIYGAAKDGERGADIFLLANAKEQSGIVYKLCGDMIKASPAMARHFRVLRDAIHYDAATAMIQHRASDSRKLDGLNPHMAIFDELHEYRDHKLLNVIRRGMTKRRQPLSLYITTMGYVLDGPMMEYYQLADDILKGNADAGVADRIFCYVAELDERDDLDDWTLWGKANPSLGQLLDIEELRREWARANRVSTERADFICKQLNIFTNASEASFIDYDVIRRNDGQIDTAALRGAECYAGFDLSATEDFTSACLIFPLDDGRVFVKSHTWVPEAKAARDNEHLDFAQYQMLGYLDICPGDHIDQDAVYNWFAEQMEQYDILSIGYDPANAPFFVRRLQSKGLICNVVRQGPLTLNGPMKAARELFLEGRVVSNNDRMFRWYLDNVRLRQDFYDRANGNWMPTKANKYRKIDGFMAFLFAYTEMIRRSPVVDEDREIDIRTYKLR